MMMEVVNDEQKGEVVRNLCQHPCILHVWRTGCKKSKHRDGSDDINDQGDSSAFTDGQQQSYDFSQGEGQSSDWGQDQFQQGAQLLILFISRIIESLSVGIPRYMKNWRWHNELDLGSLYGLQA
ncbi:hypothetical protein [Fictibacillus sp. FJAT-27399]|uniref:hypothetical protein n=1 Tax=Fictibacillus sp. FJAT-27399 TaxID=1729689 RepID=UPI000784BAAF|nr:hypothetical protein [Fictibacillus sp. FJAT-27399]